MNIQNLLKEDKTLIMGVLNVTPDSFSDGGLYIKKELAIKRAKQMIEEGADIIDVGGESSRPGADPVSEKEELKRVIPIIKALKDINAPISIDTYKPEVAKQAIANGASIINDITGLENDKMAKLAGDTNTPVIIMHMKGTPKTMQDDTNYQDIINEIKEFFKERIEKAKHYNINTIILDPGIGFGKTVEQNLTIIKHLNEFTELGPILLGTSRKSFIGKISNLPENKRLEGTIASCVIGANNGAKILRVHDIKEIKQAIQITDEIKWIK